MNLSSKFGALLKTRLPSELDENIDKSAASSLAKENVKVSPSSSVADIKLST